jgi:hypothetical protein
MLFVAAYDKLLLTSFLAAFAAALSVCRGKGKMRNRRYTLRKGPLVVYGADHGISKAFRCGKGHSQLPQQRCCHGHGHCLAFCCARMRHCHGSVLCGAFPGQAMGLSAGSAGRHQPGMRRSHSHHDPIVHTHTHPPACRLQEPAWC